MTYSHSQFRLASTAIAAAMAIFTTPAAAQEAPASVQPVTESRPAPTVTTTVDPLAPEAAAPETSTAPTVTETASETAARTNSKATLATAAHRTTTARATTSPSPARASAPVRPTARQAASGVAASTAPTRATTTRTPDTTTPAAAAPAPTAAIASTPQASASAQRSTARQSQQSGILPIVGGGALALLALAGAAVAMRRRRHSNDAVYAGDQWAADGDHAVAEPEAVIPPEPEPLVAAEAEPMSATARRADWQPTDMTSAETLAMSKPTPRHDLIDDALTTPLPAGFDLSRFGPHVQAAYRGPTEDNPSLSLRHRLRRAAALDQRERYLPEARESRGQEAPMQTGGGFMLGRENAETETREYSRQV